MTVIPLQIAPQPIVSQTPDEPKKKKPGKFVSIAETTKFFIDEAVRQKLMSYGESKIKSWTGQGINWGTKSISVRRARMVNEKAGVQVVDLNAENIKIDRFTIDDIIRGQLEHITNLTNPCEELGFAAGELGEIKEGRYITIGKERADAYNGYFKRNLFDSKRIFQLALTEPIFEKEKKLSEHTWIAIGDEHRKELMLLPNKNEIRRWIGVGVFRADRKMQKISVKNAVLIHKISGKTIFTFNKEAVEKIPILPAHLDELESLIQKFDEEGKKLDGTILQKIHHFKSQNQNEVTRELAEAINSLVGKKVFDFDSILDQAVQEAEAEVEEVQLSSSPKKRSRTEDSSGPNSKKQRTGGGSDKPLTAIVLDAPQFTLRASSATLKYPQTTPQGPAKIASKPSFDLGFLLNNKNN